MTPSHLAVRRTLFRCSHPPRPQLRRITAPQFPRRPDPALNTVSVHRAEAIRRAALLRRRNWLALGAALSMIAPIILVRLWDVPPLERKEGGTKEGESRGVVDMISPRPTKNDSPRAAADEFQGKRIVIAPGDKIIAAPSSLDNPTASDADTIELIETGTSYVPYFPKTIRLPASTGPESVESEAEYTLMGLGIRKVSFLRVQVYVVGLYIKSSDLHVLQNHLVNTVNPTASALIPGEREDLRKSLLDPEKSIQIWESILSKTGTEAVDMAFRIVPTRGTDFKHLQDALMRGIASRTDEVRRKQADLLRQQAAESKQISLPQPVEEGEFADETFGLAMKDFKAMFHGRGKAPKGSVIIMKRNGNGALDGMFQTTTKTDKGEKMGETVKLGSVTDERVSRLVWLIYLGGPNVSSEEARKSVVDGCLGIVERPVGTVETMVQ